MLGSSAGQGAISAQNVDQQKEEGEIQRKIREIENETGRLSVVLTAFIERVEPILSPQTPQPPKGCVGVESVDNALSEVGRVLSQIRERIVRMGDLVVETRERIQL